jgi:hypothetical protein
MSTKPFDAENAHLLDKVLQGEWSVGDLIEATVDETSTAASVGSGRDQQLGPRIRFQDEKLEKILGEFEEYLRKSKEQKAESLKAKTFAERRGLPDSWTRRLIEHVRKRK